MEQADEATAIVEAAAKSDVAAVSGTETTGFGECAVQEPDPHPNHAGRIQQVKDYVASAVSEYVSSASVVPVNEFDRNEELISCAFPHIFRSRWVVPTH